MDLFLKDSFRGFIFERFVSWIRFVKAKIPNYSIRFVSEGFVYKSRILTFKATICEGFYHSCTKQPQMSALWSCRDHSEILSFHKVSSYTILDIQSDFLAVSLPFMAMRLDMIYFCLPHQT